MAELQETTFFGNSLGESNLILVGIKPTIGKSLGKSNLILVGIKPTIGNSLGKSNLILVGIKPTIGNSLGKSNLILVGIKPTIGHSLGKSNLILVGIKPTIGNSLGKSNLILVGIKPTIGNSLGKSNLILVGIWLPSCRISCWFSMTSMDSASFSPGWRSRSRRRRLGRRRSRGWRFFSRRGGGVRERQTRLGSPSRLCIFGTLAGGPGGVFIVNQGNSRENGRSSWELGTWVTHKQRLRRPEVSSSHKPQGQKAGLA